MKKTLAEHIQDKKDEISLYTTNLVLDLFESACLKEIDDLSQHNKYIKYKREKCINHIGLSDIDHCSNVEEAFNCYNEIVNYLEYQKRTEIEGLIETKESRPDYIVTSKNGFRVNVDQKTLHFRDAIPHIKEMQQRFTDSKLELQEAENNREQGNFIGTPIEISSYSKIKSAERQSRKTVIERLMAKVSES